MPRRHDASGRSRAKLQTYTAEIQDLRHRDQRMTLEERGNERIWMPVRWFGMVGRGVSGEFCHGRPRRQGDALALRAVNDSIFVANESHRRMISRIEMLRNEIILAPRLCFRLSTKRIRHSV